MFFFFSLSECGNPYLILSKCVCVCVYVWIGVAAEASVLRSVHCQVFLCSYWHNESSALISLKAGKCPAFFTGVYFSRSHHLLHSKIVSIK